MIKQLSLQSELYKKFFSLADEVMMKIWNGDMDFLMASERIKILTKNTVDWWAWEYEAYGRVIHFLLFDYANGYINKIQDNSTEARILRTHIVWVFEVMDKTTDHLIYLDTYSGITYTIIGEWMGSEKRLADFNVWDIIISRLLKLEEGWYNMKNYYIISSDDENTKIAHKYLFRGAKDIFEIEERAVLMREPQNEKRNELGEINYEKRIKKLLWNKLTNKLEKELSKFFKNVDQKTFFQFQEFIMSIKWIKEEDLDTMRRYMMSYINEKSQQKLGTSDNDEFSRRMTLVMQSEMDAIMDEFPGKDFTKKFSVEDTEKVEAIRQKWLKTTNPLFSMKTPEEYLQEIDPEYDIDDLRLVQTSKEELEFYDGYTGFFTDEEHVIYVQAQKDTKEWKYKDAFNWYEKLLPKHRKFHRLRANHLSLKMNVILDTYVGLPKKIDYRIFVLENLEKDWNFMIHLKQEIKEVNALKEWYKMATPPDINEQIDYFVHTLAYLTRGKRKDIIKRLGEENNEAELMRRMQEIIPDFEREELIEEVSEIHSIYVDIYRGRTAIWMGYEVDDMYEIIPYFWRKYKKNSDFLVDDIEELYRKIGTRKFDRDALNDFCQFVKEKKWSINHKRSQVKQLFSESMNYSQITECANILKKIEDADERKVFLEALSVLGINMK